jgi:hypothetical protein
VHWLMSALGQKRTLRHSLDHLVGASKQRGRNGETERLRGLEVEDKFEFGRLHNRKVRRFLTLKDAASVEPDLSVRVGETCSVAGQAGRSDKQTARIDCWDRVAGRQSNQLIADADKEDIGANKKRFGARLDKTGKAASKSLTLLAFKTVICCPIACAADCRSRASSSLSISLGSVRNAMPSAAGTSSRSSSSRFATSAVLKKVAPVILPPVD